ncbi:hypothetical protein TeGR_g5305 [Tetraparma gracilis]|uniref:AMP-activated protein kinase glycogen-binding domain-containing protein n=1 Tax=Tetraparma gracilis TaxID=2962635 RepID=A0ABQ6M6V2_9STRA|nr:hypothetical protein TeGR_g5305 [Tetraparma gracilis]
MKLLFLSLLGFLASSALGEFLFEDTYPNFGFYVTDATTEIRRSWDCKDADEGGYTPPPAADEVSFEFKFDLNAWLATDGAGAEAPGSLFMTGEADSWNGWGTELRDSDADGIYTATMNLMPGSYQFLILLNGNDWDNKISALLDSDCDFLPGDQHNNFGYEVTTDTTLISLTTDCVMPSEEEEDVVAETSAPTATPTEIGIIDLDGSSSTLAPALATLVATVLSLSLGGLF